MPCTTVNDELRQVFERLTGQARRAVAAAYREARANHDDYVGTEHILLGLLHESATGAGVLLRLSAIDPDRLQRQICLLLQSQSHGADVAQLPLTPGARRAFAWAAEEADAARQRRVGPEHILIGLTYEEESLAHFLLVEAGVAIEALRAALPRLPPHENRDQLVQALPPSGEPALADPTSAQLVALLTGEPTGTSADAEPTLSSPNHEWAGARADLRGQTGSVQVLLGLFMGAAVGATFGSWKMLLCMVAGVAVGALRNSWLGALAGAVTGLALAHALCRDQLTEAMLLILVALIAGIFMGDGPANWIAGHASPGRQDTLKR